MKNLLRVMELFILTLSGLSTLTGHRAATCQSAKLLTVSKNKIENQKC